MLRAIRPVIVALDSFPGRHRQRVIDDHEDSAPE